MSRNPIFDNAKFLMVLLVVFGHLIEPFIKTHGLVKVVWMFIYTFHMPTFVFLAGLVTKESCNQFDFRKDIESILVPFFIFTILFEIYNYLTTGAISGYTRGLMPFWVLWFLPSLLIWRITTSYFMHFRFPIIIAFVITLSAGYFKEIGYFLGLSRTIYFFPFFLMGFYSKDLWILFEKRRIHKNWLFFSLLSIIAILVFIMKDQAYQWLFGSYSYQKLSIHGIDAALTRAMIYIISTLCIIAILGLIPSKKSFISEQGRNSLYVYLWHGFIVKILINLGVINFLLEFRSPVILSAMFITALITSYFLSTIKVRFFTEKYLFRPFKKITLYNRTKP